MSGVVTVARVAHASCAFVCVSRWSLPLIDRMFVLVRVWSFWSHNLHVFPLFRRGKKVDRAGHRNAAVCGCPQLQPATVTCHLPLWRRWPSALRPDSDRDGACDGRRLFTGE